MTDNDSLASYVAVEMEADLLVLLSDIDGIYSGPPSAPNSRIIRHCHPELFKSITIGQKSSTGRGGMKAKVRNVYPVRPSHHLSAMRESSDDSFISPLYVSPFFLHLSLFHPSPSPSSFCSLTLPPFPPLPLLSSPSLLSARGRSVCM